MEKKKSELQKKLESQGWELLTNTIPEMDTNLNDELMCISTPCIVPKSDQELKANYLERGFKDVKVDDAYNIHGNCLPGMRSIYVKR